MEEMAEKAAEHLNENLFPFLLIALVAGYLAVQSVMPGKKGGVILYVIVGVLGAFLGQVGMLYFDLNRYIGGVPDFRLLFDLVATYAGAFIFASLIHFLKPF